MNMKRKAKKFATILKLMVGATVLTSCGKDINENEIASVYEIDDSGIVVFGHAEDCTDVSDYGKKVKITHELLKKIKEKVEEYNSGSLHIFLEKTSIDFTDIDISNVRSLIIDCPNIDFNYVPFYDNAYESVSIVINENTNKEDIINFLQKVNFIANEYDETNTRPSLNIEFKEKVSVDLINEYLEVISKIENLNSFDIETSANINEINLANVKCNNLSIKHNTNKEINYNIAINDNVKDFNLQTSYSENYKEDEILLKQLIINSNNEELDIYYYVDGLAKIYDDTIVTLPNNSAFELVNVNVNDISTSWYRQFSNTSRTNIRKSNKSYHAYFYYNSSEGNIDDAITDMHFEDLEKEAKAILEANGINIYTSSNNLVFDATSDSNIVLTNDRVYEYINALIRRENISEIDCGTLDNQIDFNRIDLSNIEYVNISKVGYNFDYTILKDTNRKPLENVAIHIQKDTNHRNKIDYLKTLNLKDGYNLAFIIDDDVDANIVSSYLTELDLTNLSTLQINYLHIDEMDLSTLNVPALYLNISYNESRINYKININESVEAVTLDFDCDVPMTDVVISNIAINSSNNDLITYIYTTNKTFAVDCCVDDTSIISVPTNSHLSIVGIKEMSISASFLKQFNDLDVFNIIDHEVTYVYNYKKNREAWEYTSQSWEYNGRQDEEQKLLKELK